MEKLPNDYPKDIKDEKKDSAKYAVEAKKDPANKKPLSRLSKEETGHMNTLKAIVKKHRA
jgi:rubrerythrin